jgi:hypothetical protein
MWKKSWIDKIQGSLQSWIDIADKYKIEIEASETKPSHDPIGKEIENSFREFIKEGKDQGNLRSDLSDQAIIAYFKFFQQGISNNPGISDRMRRNSKLSRDLLSLFMYGISGQSG